MAVAPRCVVCFSISNIGHENFTSADHTYNYRPFPTYAKTIAVGASINANPTNPIPDSYFTVPGQAPNTPIPTQVDRRALYNPYGSKLLRKPDIVAPSHTAYRASGTLVDPIVSCVRVGTGNLNGCLAARSATTTAPASAARVTPAPP